MELFKNIRQKIGNAILQNKVSRTKRKISYDSLSKVKKIGIVWDASKTEDFSYLSKFFQKMADNKAEVSILGYYPDKTLPNQYTAIRYLSIIKKEELSFFYQPSSGETNSFISKEFDVLIDLNFKKLLQLKYVTSLSHARFKVGLTEAGSVYSPFDLMLDIKNPGNVEEYLNHVMHYLEMIKSPSVN
jgi:hypothetical protein